MKSLIICALCTLWGSGVAFGFSLPWLSEDSAIERALNKIWYAIIQHDEKNLRAYYLTGLTVDTFLKQETDEITRMGTREITCTIKQVQLDPVSKQWAWVDFEKSAQLKSGHTLGTRSFVVMKKENGYWKLFTGASTRQNARQRPPKKPANVQDANAKKTKDPRTTNTAGDKAAQVPADSQTFKFDVSVSGEGK
ncbi:MAG: hypothetical protein AB1646_04995 [Thermodesulfobacteriota bacterium]